MPRSDTAATLSAELEAKLLARLALEWESLNLALFRGVLRRPVLSLSNTAARLGQWRGELRSLELSRPLVLDRPWVEVQEVLKHELAHQFVDECLAVDEPPHGPAFVSVCERLGIDAGATASPPLGDGPRSADPSERIVGRIRKLLALAQSPNQHEAEAAAVAARRLMLKYNVEIERSDADPRARTDHSFVHLGRPSGRIYEHQRRLADILTRYFFVEGLWIPVYRPREGKRGSVLEICGRPANLAMAEHVHAFLSATAQRLWDEYKRTRKKTGTRDRLAFLAGVMRGFETKLAAQDHALQDQGLVWVPGAELRRYFRRRHPRTETIRRSGVRRNEAFGHGHEAGQRIVLSKPVESRSERSGPRALPPSRS